MGPHVRLDGLHLQDGQAAPGALRCCCCCLPFFCLPLSPPACLFALGVWLARVYTWMDGWTDKMKQQRQQASKQAPPPPLTDLIHTIPQKTLKTNHSWRSGTGSSSRRWAPTPWRPPRASTASTSPACTTPTRRPPPRASPEHTAHHQLNGPSSPHPLLFSFIPPPPVALTGGGWGVCEGRGGVCVGGGPGGWLGC